jgi:transcriptional regulator
MLVKKLGLRILFLAMLTGIILVPVVNSQEEDNYSVPVEKAFEHANAHVIDFVSSGAPDFENWTGASIDPKPLELYDINGQKLFYEFSAYKKDTLVGKIYVGANKTLGPSVQVIETTPNSYNTTEATKKSIEIAKKEYPDGEIKSTKVVEYSYPRIGAMTVVKDNTGEEHRIFVDVYSLDVVPDRPATETQLGVWSMYEQKLKKNGIDENLREWQKSDEFVKSIEKEAANKGICISVPIILDNYSNFEVTNVDFDYYTYFFGLDSYGNIVITRYGKLPALETEQQKENWNSTLENLSNEIKDAIASKYMYPHGEAVTCGANDKGYFVILFKYGNVDESLMNEVYSLIDNSAKKMGIQDAPVEFGYGTYRNREIILDTDQEIIHEFGGSTTNLSESEMRALEEYMKKKPTIPLHKNIATYGKIPLLKDQDEIIAWADKLSAISGSTQIKLIRI